MHDMNKKFKVFITRDILEDGPDYLHKNNLEVTIFTGKLPPTFAQLVEGANKADALIPMVTDKIDKKLIDALPELKVISSNSVGFNNIDIAYAKEKGIIVTNTPDVLTQATAELTLGLIFDVARNLSTSRQWVKNGQWKTWDPKGHLGMELKGKTLGIIGAGRIGQCVAKMLQRALDMDIYYCGPSQKESFEKATNATYTDLPNLLKSSDVVSIHCPLNSQTHHLINKSNLKLMKPHGLIFNTSRGEIINTEDLLFAVNNNLIAGAGLDVTDPEPLPSSHPILNAESITITPHIGSATKEARAQMSLLAAKNIVEVLNNRPPLNPV